MDDGANVGPFGYVGRFAPSPTGPLHAGSLVAALASWLDAKAHGGRWLVRIEDVDRPRCVAGADAVILGQLSAVGLLSGEGDASPTWQSTRAALYERALSRLMQAGWAYPCGCSRRDIELSWAARGVSRPRHAELIYPGTCRPENGGLAGKAARAFRLRTTDMQEARNIVSVADRACVPTRHIDIHWHDRRLGPQHQNITESVGDFVLRRADGLWAYQLAVVVDDAEQGVTAIVRGEDLADNTARQIHLQRLLGLATPSYLHTPLVLAASGEKLSKRSGAEALDLRNPVLRLREAGQVLGLELLGATLGEVLASGTLQWGERYKLASSRSAGEASSDRSNEHHHQRTTS